MSDFIVHTFQHKENSEEINFIAKQKGTSTRRWKEIMQHLFFT